MRLPRPQPRRSNRLQRKSLLKMGIRWMTVELFGAKRLSIQKICNIAFAIEHQAFGWLSDVCGYARRPFIIMTIFPAHMESPSPSPHSFSTLRDGHSD